MTLPSRVSVALLLVILTGAGGLALLRAGIFGWTIFVVAPLLIGGITEWAYRSETQRKAALLGAIGAFGATFSLLVLGVEGLICILMTLPLAVPIGALGGMIVFHLRQSPAAARGAALLLLVPPASLRYDATARPPVFEVHSSLEIAASPEVVWRNVVTFSDLQEPREWYFRAGLAYPKRARIEGSGTGAVRYCEFSTGPFVEPIDVWNEPRLLRFHVTQNPAPMHEWSPYAKIAPRHLHGYLVSKQGQFRLTALPGGRTLLEGTTWYQHGLWPAQYWRWWSDAIIRRIHLRVLNHIAELSTRR
jgi:hypothetical protein